MRYSAWGKDGCDFLFIQGEEMSPEQSRLSPGMRLLRVFEAPSWNDAMRQYHEWQGWEPYKPMRDKNGNEYPEDYSAPDSE